MKQIEEKRNEIINKCILWGILLVAAVLRFYDYFNIPFTHDELSALFRTQFDSFSELIEKGVKTGDTHPPAIQVFLYYWVKLFGTSEWVVKLPFTLFGLLSVGLIYLIAKKWYNETVGLISAAFLASIQYMVIYSQTERPYISGLFFSLAMVYFLTQLIQNPEKNFYKNSAFYILFASLCAYNHHFSLLFVAITGLTGLFLIQRKYIVKYLINASVIMILYIPNIPIVLYQMKIGGVEGWLAKPHNDFIINYLSYIFQYSIISIFLVAGLVIFGFVKRAKMNDKLLLVSVLWFLLPFLIGFFYSKYVNAVLQYSVLIFSFPFLFFILFGHLKKQKPLINITIVAIILTINIFLLINERKHYTLFYNSPYVKILEDHETAQREHENVVSFVDSHRKITQYYCDKIPVQSPFFVIDSLNEKQLIALVKEQVKTADYLYLGAFSSNLPNTVPIIQDYFPRIEWQNNYLSGTTYLFSKEKRNRTDTIHFSEAEPLFTDSSNMYSCSFSKPFYEIIYSQYNFIDISVKVLVPENYNDIVLVASLEDKKGNIHWGGSSFDKYISDDDIGQWITIHHSVKLSDIYLKKNNITFKTYIWNKGNRNFTVKDFSVFLREGNSVVYGLLSDIYPAPVSSSCKKR
jgi:uncharacterized membrane protein